MTSTRSRLMVLGGNPLHGSDALDSRMGDCLWDLSLGQSTSGHGQQGRSLDDARFQTVPFCSMLYIEQWKFRFSMDQTIANGCPDPRCPGQTGVLFRFRQSVDLVHIFKTMEGLLLLVPPRTPQSSGYDVYAHPVYVVICYMYITCICVLHVVICYMSVIGYMSVICLVLGTS
jgi:hypothetical protein